MRYNFAVFNVFDMRGCAKARQNSLLDLGGFAPKVVQPGAILFDLFDLSEISPRLPRTCV